LAVSQPRRTARRVAQRAGPARGKAQAHGEASFAGWRARQVHQRRCVACRRSRRPVFPWRAPGRPAVAEASLRGPPMGRTIAKKVSFRRATDRRWPGLARLARVRGLRAQEAACGPSVRIGGRNHRQRRLPQGPDVGERGMVRSSFFDIFAPPLET